MQETNGVSTKEGEATRCVRNVSYSLHTTPLTDMILRAGKNKNKYYRKFNLSGVHRMED